MLNRMIMSKFTEIMVGNEAFARRKVLSGIVMTRGPDLKLSKVKILFY